MTFYQMCWYFFLYSFFGWVVEVIFHAVSKGQIVNRGFVNGPICPIYGLGVLSVFAMVNTMENLGVPMNDLGIFVFGLILATSVELFGGWLLDKCFHARWWDYSEQPLNLHGYICLKFSLIWGVAILLVVRILQKHVERRSVFRTPSKPGWIIIIVLSAIFVADLVVTVAVIQGFNKRLTKLNELREEMRIVSDKLSAGIGGQTIAATQKLEEQRVQVALAKAELRDALSEKTTDTIEELSRRLDSLQRRFEELTTAMTAHSLFGPGRLLRAFANMKHGRNFEIVEMLKGKIGKRSTHMISSEAYARLEHSVELARTIGGADGVNAVAELDPSLPKFMEALKRGEGQNIAGSLGGVPILVKDNIDVKGLHTTAGSLALADNIASEDAHVIKNLRRNGAVIIGKTNMTEFANFTTKGMPAGYSSRGGQVIHAADRNRTPSGSSSGSGVAVAAGIVPMAVGTDTSFSVVICARENGICGLKPPAGVLSPEGIIPIARTLDSAGAMANTFTDALRLYSAMRDEALPEVRAADVGKLKLAVNTVNRDMNTQEYNGFIDRAVRKLKENGAEVSEIAQPPVKELPEVMTWEFREQLEDYLRTSSASRKTLREIVDYYEANPDTMMRYGDSLLRDALDNTPGGTKGEHYLQIMRLREETIVNVSEQLKDIDAVILTGPSNIMHFCGFACLNIAGSERDESGVRRGIVLYGSDEMRLYRAALAVEKLI